jgi:hypothetical protein
MEASPEVGMPRLVQTVQAEVAKMAPAPVVLAYFGCFALVADSYNYSRVSLSWGAADPYYHSFMFLNIDI